MILGYIDVSIVQLKFVRYPLPRASLVNEWSYTSDHKRQTTRLAQAVVASVEYLYDGDTMPDDAVVPVFVFDPPISTSSFVVKFKEVSPLVELPDVTFLSVNKSDRSMRHTSL